MFEKSMFVKNMFGFGGSSQPSRPMKYPYTLSAKIAQFPVKFYLKNVWMTRYYVYSFFVCLPLFYWIQTLACTPENTKKWNDIRQRERDEALEHLR